VEAKLGKSVALGKRRNRDEEDGDEDGSDESDEPSEEDEDEDGELVTEALDNEIMATLNAIRSKDPRVYDKDATFYSKFDEDAPEQLAEKKEKPMTLRDYHRENLLKGAANGEEEEQPPKSFAQEQEDLKKSIVKELHAVADESVDKDEDDDGFLVQKSVTAPAPEPKKHIELDVENSRQRSRGFPLEFLGC
jgi:hypothetical protein